MEELIQKAQKGDREAFTQIILSIRNDLYKIAKTRISNEEDINDAIQETMLEAYKSIKKLKDIKKLKSWVTKILINNCNKIYKKNYKNESVTNNYYQNNNLTFNSNENIENNLNFYSLLENLKYEERIISTLYYMEDYKIEEIGKILKMKKNTVKTHLFRARQKIRLNYMGGNQIEGKRV